MWVWVILASFLVLGLSVATWCLYQYPFASSAIALYPSEEYVHGPLLARQYATPHPSTGELAYLNRSTEYRATASEMDHMVHNPVVWVRLGSPNLLQKLGMAWSRSCDVDTFARDVLPRCTQPCVLVTSDGDRSVPRDLSASTVHTLLTHPLVKAWYSQNCDTATNQRLRHVPIGLRHHVAVPGASCSDWMQDFLSAAHAGLNSSRQLRIWSDCHLTGYPLRHSNPRGCLRQLVDSGALVYVDAPTQRVPQKELWRTYTEYAFVFSLAGNGLDCHRTWEALYLGAIVITEPTPLSPLYQPYRVVEVERSEWTTKLNDLTWLRQMQDEQTRKPVFADTPEVWYRRFGQTLTPENAKPRPH